MAESQSIHAFSREFHSLGKAAPDQTPVERQLRQLRQDSLDLLEDYSFNPTHQTLKALQIMRHHQGVTSARQAFPTFWSEADHLQERMGE